jgi:hypothetical protein
MQTVNFQCGHCGKLMAVSVEFLGQQVRCPHCQQVVLAPATDGHPPAEDPFCHLTGGGPSQEDIFWAPAGAEDALFGRGEPSPLEVAPEPPPTPPPQDVPTIEQPTLPDVPATDSPAPAAGDPGPGTWPAGGARSVPVMAEVAGSPPGPIAGEPAPVRRARADAGRINWFIPLVFIPLVLYAVLATAAAGFLYLRAQTSQPTSPFDQMPDVDGDNPGVRKASARLVFDRRKATAKLPDHLIVPLGQTLRVGDLEVTPTRVERKRVAVMVEGFARPERCPYDSLVLHLRLRNLADGYAFTPLDNYFDRRWDGKTGAAAPLTVLMASDQAFFGGPARWLPLNRPRRDNTYREWVEGRVNTDPVGLRPGEATETFVCTDGGNPAVARVLFGSDADGKRVGKPYRGELLWRVHLRRGLITHKGRRLPAACVIGVAFPSTAYAA